MGSAVSVLSMSFIDAMVEHKGFSHIETDNVMMMNDLGVNPITRQFEMGTYRCFLLDKNQSLEYRTPLAFQSYLGERAEKVMTFLRESGIERFWSSVAGWRFLQRDRAIQLNLVEGKMAAKLPTPISLQSHVQIVFFLWLISLCFGVVCFFGEVFVWWVNSKCFIGKGTKVKTKKRLVPSTTNEQCTRIQIWSEAAQEIDQIISLGFF
jgi:hypothetical protein